MRIGIAHVGMGRGGSEARAMWGIEALKKRCDVSLLTAGEVDLRGLNEFYGTSVRADELTVRRAPLLPFMRNRSAAALRAGLFQRFCRRIAGEFDVLVSAYNPCDFGVPAIHFVADFSWNNALREELHPMPATAQALVHRKGPLRRAYLGVARGLGRPSGRDLFAGDDVMVANSPFTARLLEERFGLCDVLVVYPPVLGPEVGVAFEQRERGFVCLGRVSHEKRIDRIIRILSGVRGLGHDLHLHIIGSIDETPNGLMVRRLCDENRTWVFPEGRQSGERKWDLLGSHRYGIHGCPGETFGIAVAEMAKAGCVTFVPEFGGPASIVGDPRLCYGEVEDAVHKIDAILRDEALQRELSGGVRCRSEEFSARRFMDEFRTVVEDFAGARLERTDA